jgi:hypothetical protein
MPHRLWPTAEYRFGSVLLAFFCRQISHTGTLFYSSILLRPKTLYASSRVDELRWGNNGANARAAPDLPAALGCLFNHITLDAFPSSLPHCINYSSCLTA